MPARLPKAPTRTALITDATSGIGLQVSIALAAQGYAVTLIGRDRKRLAACLALVATTARDPGACGTELVDLSDLAQVGAAARAIRARGRPLSILVNNAAVMAPARHTTGPDGYELQMTVNHLAHHVLTATLLPLLREMEGGRVVTVSSIRHHDGDMDDPAPWSPLPYDPRRSYATSKLWGLAYALWLDNALMRDPAGTRSVAAHPGWARTNLHGAGPFRSGITAAGTLRLLATACLAQSAGRDQPAHAALSVASAPRTSDGGLERIWTATGPAYGRRMGRGSGATLSGPVPIVWLSNGGSTRTRRERSILCRSPAWAEGTIGSRNAQAKGRVFVRWARTGRLLVARGKPALAGREWSHPQAVRASRRARAASPSAISQSAVSAAL